MRQVGVESVQPPGGTRWPKRPRLLEGRSRGVGLRGSATAWGSTPRQLRWPLRRGQLSRPRGQPQVLHNGAHPTRSRQVHQHPPPAPTPLASEDVEAERPPQRWRPVHSRRPLLLRPLAGRCLRRPARLLRSCLGELGGAGPLGSGWHSYAHVPKIQSVLSLRYTQRRGVSAIASAVCSR